MKEAVFFSVMALVAVGLWLLFAKLLVVLYNRIGDPEERITVAGITAPVAIIAVVVAALAWARVNCNTCPEVIHANWLPLALSLSLIIVYRELKQVATRPSRKLSRYAMAKLLFALVLIGSVAAGILWPAWHAPPSAIKEVKSVDSDGTLDPTLVVLAGIFNKSVPIVVDEETTLTKVSVMSGRRLHYRFQWESSVPWDPEEKEQLFAGLRRNAIKKSCWEPQARFLLSKAAEVVSDYYDKTGTLLGQVRFSIADCRIP